MKRISFWAELGISRDCKHSTEASIYHFISLSEGETFEEDKECQIKFYWAGKRYTYHFDGEKVLLTVVMGKLNCPDKVEKYSCEIEDLKSVKNPSGVMMPKWVEI